jgi:hypothetical protein
MRKPGTGRKGRKDYAKDAKEFRRIFMDVPLRPLRFFATSASGSRIGI